MTTPLWAISEIQSVQEKGGISLDLKPIENEKPLNEIPPEVFKITDLRDLNLSENTIKKIPDEIEKLKNLKELHLSGNNLESLPDVLEKLANLSILHLDQNRFHVFPECVTKLKKLKILDLSRNGLMELPPEIGKLKNLTWLDLSSNNIKQVPDAISALVILRTLNLSSNKIESLPITIGSLDNLFYLDLSNNQLISLPQEIVNLKRIKEINLYSNPLIAPPPEVARKGIDAISEYFRQLEKGQDYLYEAKLLVLGEGGAGKTTLANKILDSSYELRDEKSTRGVDILEWAFPFKERQFRINIWDFGGQEIYHTTHQFFLTKRSLYVLVADTRKEDTDFYYWLNLIELLSDNSPLLIVKNEMQNRHRELNERLLRGEFENLKEVLAANFADNRGLEKIKEEIKHYITALPHVGSVLPKSWLEVRRILEQETRNHISLDEYLKICKNHGFFTEKDSLQLSEYLHDIGVFLHFQDDDLLNKTVILKPEWGTTAVYKVLDNPQVIKNLGQFTRKDLMEIWNEPDYIKMHGELIQLMMKFRLCYKIPDTSDSYIAPQLLTENQPMYDWKNDDNLFLRYSYQFMPKGILTQFIVLMHRLILEQKNVWKSGVVLEKEKTRAEVIEYYGRREIQVRISGINKKELMAIIMYQFDNIHASYRRLKYDKLIPCNCSECKSNQAPYFYRFDILRKFIDDGQKNIQCQQSYKMVNVRGMVDDVVSKDYRSNREGDVMTQNFYFGNGTRIENLITGSSIQSSFNKAESADISIELKGTLQQLAEAVDKMSKDIPRELAIEIADDLEKLVNEATKEVPNKKWYNISAEELIKAAENAGKIGTPVIVLASKVIELLQQVSIK